MKSEKIIFNKLLDDDQSRNTIHLKKDNNYLKPLRLWLFCILIILTIVTIGFCVNQTYLNRQIVFFEHKINRILSEINANKDEMNAEIKKFFNYTNYLSAKGLISKSKLRQKRSTNDEINGDLEIHFTKVYIKNLNNK